MKIPAFKRHQKIFSYGGIYWGRNPCSYILYRIKYIVFFFANPCFERWQTIFHCVEGVQCVLLWQSLPSALEPSLVPLLKEVFLPHFIELPHQSWFRDSTNITKFLNDVCVFMSVWVCLCNCLSVFYCLYKCFHLWVVGWVWLCLIVSDTLSMTLAMYVCRYDCWYNCVCVLVSVECQVKRKAWEWWFSFR